MSDQDKRLGVYFHIPFCASKCAYCDFCSLPGRDKLMPYYQDALLIQLQETMPRMTDYFIDTVYFGGGTPSYYGARRIVEILQELKVTNRLMKQSEITVECNPDSVRRKELRMLRKEGVNRLSIGAQSANDDILRLIGRRHNWKQVEMAVGAARDADFDNLSIDLIYGLPGETDRRWQDDLQQAVALDVEHISAYHLTYEEGTPLYDMLQAHRVSQVDEDSSLRFFSALTDTLGKAGYVHYEISNFCKPGRHSRHNTSYWQGIPYLGCGPSAHSFDGVGREWNVSSLTQYIEGMESGNRPFETEYRDTATRYNECVMTALRTMWGIPMKQLRQEYGEKLYRYCLDMAAPYLTDGKLELKDGFLRLTRRGIFVSDGISENDQLKGEEII